MGFTYLDLRGLEDLKGHLTFAVYFNSEGFAFHFKYLNIRGLEDLKCLDLDLRGLKDLKGGPQRSPTNSYLCGLRSQRLP